MSLLSSSMPGLSNVASSVADAAPSVDPNARNRKECTCSVCFRVFSTATRLARHSHIHTGERKHPCPFPKCQRICARQDNLQQHYRKVHLSPGRGSRRRSGRNIIERSQGTPTPSPPAETESNSPSSSVASVSASYRDESPPLEPPLLEDSCIFYLRAAATANQMAGTDLGHWVMPPPAPPLIDDIGFDCPPRTASALSKQAYWSLTVASMAGVEGCRPARASPVASTSSRAYTLPPATRSATAPSSTHYTAYTSSPRQHPAQSQEMLHLPSPPLPPLPFRAHAHQTYDHSRARHAQPHSVQPPQPAHRTQQPQPMQHRQPQPAQPQPTQLPHVHPTRSPQPVPHIQPQTAQLQPASLFPQAHMHPDTFHTTSLSNVVPVSPSLHSLDPFAHLLTRHLQHPAQDRNALARAYAHQGLPPAYAPPGGARAKEAYPFCVSPTGSPPPSGTSTHSSHTPFHEPTAVHAQLPLHPAYSSSECDAHVEMDHAYQDAPYIRDPAYSSSECDVHAEMDYAYQDAPYTRDRGLCSPAYPEPVHKGACTVYDAHARPHLHYAYSSEARYAHTETDYENQDRDAAYAEPCAAAYYGTELCVPAYHTHWRPLHESACTVYDSDASGHIVSPQCTLVFPSNGCAHPDGHSYMDTHTGTTNLWQVATLSLRDSESFAPQDTSELSVPYMPFLHHPSPQPPRLP